MIAQKEQKPHFQSQIINNDGLQVNLIHDALWPKRRILFCQSHRMEEQKRTLFMTLILQYQL